MAERTRPVILVMTDRPTEPRMRLSGRAERSSTPTARQEADQGACAHGALGGAAQLRAEDEQGADGGRTHGDGDGQGHHGKIHIRRSLLAGALARDQGHGGKEQQAPRADPEAVQRNPQGGEDGVAGEYRMRLMTMTAMVVRMAVLRCSALVMFSVMDRKTVSTKKGVSRKKSLMLRLMKRLIMDVSECAVRRG